MIDWKAALNAAAGIGVVALAHKLSGSPPEMWDYAKLAVGVMIAWPLLDLAAAGIKAWRRRRFKARSLWQTLPFV